MRNSIIAASLLIAAASLTACQNTPQGKADAATRKAADAVNVVEVCWDKPYRQMSAAERLACSQRGPMTDQGGGSGE
jgi:hypothetical protein